MSGYVWSGKPAPTPRPYTKIKCGTPSGYTFHYRIGQKPCPACTKAHNEPNAANKQKRNNCKTQTLAHADYSSPPPKPPTGTDDNAHKTRRPAHLGPE